MKNAVTKTSPPRKGAAGPRRNIKLVIAYNGAAYHGWQRQAKPHVSVQQLVEESAARVLGHPVTIYGASRTDAGVHALGQVANFYTTNSATPVRGLRLAMNSILPPDISIQSATLADEPFHASRDARGKTYVYRIYVSPIRPVLLHHQVYYYWRPLEADPMGRAARRLVGTHDFRGLTTTMETRENTVRTITRCEVAEQECEIRLTVQGDGFLYNMVRNIAGTLIEIGRGHWKPDQIDKILASRNRADAGPTAPPDGLTLVCVHY